MIPAMMSAPSFGRWIGRIPWRKGDRCGFASSRCCHRSPPLPRPAASAGRRAVGADPGATFRASTGRMAVYPSAVSDAPEPTPRPRRARRVLHVRIFSSASDAPRSRRPTDALLLVVSIILVSTFLDTGAGRHADRHRDLHLRAGTARHRDRGLAGAVRPPVGMARRADGWRCCSPTAASGSCATCCSRCWSRVGSSRWSRSRWARMSPRSCRMPSAPTLPRGTSPPDWPSPPR